MSELSPREVVEGFDNREDDAATGSERPESISLFQPPRISANRGGGSRGGFGESAVLLCQALCGKWILTGEQASPQTRQRNGDTRLKVGTKFRRNHFRGH